MFCGFWVYGFFEFLCKDFFMSPVGAFYWWYFVYSEVGLSGGIVTARERDLQSVSFLRDFMRSEVACGIECTRTILNMFFGLNDKSSSSRSTIIGDVLVYLPQL